MPVCFRVDKRVSHWIISRPNCYWTFYSLPRGWAEPQRKANLVHFSLKISHLVAPILLIFLRINEHTSQLLVEPNALWPTQPKFWVGHGPPAHAAAAPWAECVISYGFYSQLWRRRYGSGSNHTVLSLALIDLRTLSVGYCAVARVA